jgi:hypothetical protein
MKRPFRISAIVGTTLLSVCIIVTYLDARLDFIGDRYSTLVAVAILGLILSLSGLLGWAARLDRRSRIWMAVLVFFYPLIAISIGIPVVGRTEPGLLIHGVGVLFLPASILAAVLIAMAVAARA